MLFFENDYSFGALPKLLEDLSKRNLQGQAGYGADDWSSRAQDLIRQASGLDQAQVHFLVGGTQANQVVIDTLLSNYQGVIAADTGHIASHEAGAIEFVGHKVLTLPHDQGKISAQQVEDLVAAFYADPSHPHMVYPGMVYISFPTEFGTLYSKEELRALYQVCQTHHLPLFIDGARLPYGLTSPENDLSFQELASFCDVFTMGGTKCGALFGEAVVFKSDSLPPHFVTQIKQHGALLAKGFVTGSQFYSLLEEGDYWTHAKRAVELAMGLKEGLVELGFEVALDSPTNQQFFLVTPDQYQALTKNIKITLWEPRGDKLMIRLVTSWATTDQDVQDCLAYFAKVAR